MDEASQNVVGLEAFAVVADASTYIGRHILLSIYIYIYIGGRKL